MSCTYVYSFPDPEADYRPRSTIMDYIGANLSYATYISPPLWFSRTVGWAVVLVTGPGSLLTF